MTGPHLVNGQPNQMNFNVTDSRNIQYIPVKKVQVEDIDIAYKKLGKGDPILLVSPAQADMNAWEPSTLKELSSNHTVIVFDNRGVGNTTTGNKPFSIHQFANDTAGLLDALNIEKADVLGFSLGSLVAQQLAVMHPEKIIRLILDAASCGGKESIPPSPQVLKMSIDIENKSANDIPITPQEVKALLALGLGSGRIKLHPSYLEYHQPAAVTLAPPAPSFAPALLVLSAPAIPLIPSALIPLIPSAPSVPLTPSAPSIPIAELVFVLLLKISTSPLSLILAVASAFFLKLSLNLSYLSLSFFASAD